MTAFYQQPVLYN